MNNLRNPYGPASDAHADRHLLGALDELDFDRLLSDLNFDPSLRNPVDKDVIVASGTPVHWNRVATGAAGTVFIGGSSFSANLLLSGYARVGSASVPTNVTTGDLTVVRLLVGNAALTANIEAQITGDAIVTGYMRVGSATNPTNVTAGDFTATRLLAGDATLASGVVAAFAGNQTTTGYTQVGSATAPSNTTAGDLTALRGHFGTDGAFTSGMELEVVGDFRVSGTIVGAGWTSVAFVAGNFTANAGATWGLTSPDQVTFAYDQIRKLVMLALTLDQTSISVATPTVLSVALPFTAAKTMSQICFVNDNGTLTVGLMTVTTGSATLTISRLDGVAFALAANTTYIRGVFAFEVQ